MVRSGRDHRAARVRLGARADTNDRTGTAGAAADTACAASRRRSTRSTRIGRPNRSRITTSTMSAFSRGRVDAGALRRLPAIAGVGALGRRLSGVGHGVRVIGGRLLTARSRGSVAGWRRVEVGGRRRLTRARPRVDAPRWRSLWTVGVCDPGRSGSLLTTAVPALAPRAGGVCGTPAPPLALRAGSVCGARGSGITRGDGGGCRRGRGRRLGFGERGRGRRGRQLLEHLPVEGDRRGRRPCRRGRRAVRGLREQRRRQFGRCARRAWRPTGPAGCRRGDRRRRWRRPACIR